MKTQTVSPATYEDCTVRELPGEVYGPFVIHRTIQGRGLSAWAWTVTHVGTGYAAMQWCTSRLQAVRVARALVATRVSWQFNHPKKMSVQTRKAGERVTNRYRALWNGQQVTP